MVILLPSPDTPESKTNLDFPSDVLIMLAERPKLSPLLLIRLRIFCSVSPAFTSIVNSSSPALNVSVPSAVTSDVVELSNVPSCLLVVANLLTVILYWPFDAPVLVVTVITGSSES